MIKVDFVLALGFFLSTTIICFFLNWLFSHHQKGDKILLDSETLIQCPYCTHLFPQYEKKDLIKCPQCKSYFNVEENFLNPKAKDRRDDTLS